MIHPVCGGRGVFCCPTVCDDSATLRYLLTSFCERTCAITTLYKLGDRMKLFVHNHCVLAYSSVLKLSVNTSILSFIHSSIIQNNRYTRIKQSFLFIRTCYLRFLFLRHLRLRTVLIMFLFFQSPAYTGMFFVI